MFALNKIQIQMLPTLLEDLKTHYPLNYANEAHLLDREFIDLYGYMWRMHSYTQMYDVATFYDIFLMSPANIHLHYGLENSKFKRFYRIDLATFKLLVSHCRQSIGCSLLPDIAVEIQLACIFWRFSNTHFGSFVLIRSGISALSCEDICSRFIKTLIHAVSGNYICWPSNDESRAQELANKFKCSKYPLEGALGVMHNERIALLDNAMDGGNVAGGTNTVTTSRLTVINLIGVLDYKQRFLLVEATIADNRSNQPHAFPSSTLFKTIMQDPKGMFPKETYLIADSSFPLMDNVIPPFSASDTARPRQVLFNRVHSQTTEKTKLTYDELISRWQFLWAHELTHEKRVQTFYASCILHNMCIETDDQEDTNCKDLEFYEGFVKRSAITAPTTIKLQKGHRSRPAPACFSSEHARSVIESAQAGYIRREWLASTLDNRRFQASFHA